jgi:hypothetical protein
MVELLRCTGSLDEMDRFLSDIEKAIELQMLTHANAISGDLGELLGVVSDQLQTQDKERTQLHQSLTAALSRLQARGSAQPGTTTITSSDL